MDIESAFGLGLRGVKAAKPSAPQSPATHVVEVPRESDCAIPLVGLQRFEGVGVNKSFRTWERSQARRASANRSKDLSRRGRGVSIRRDRALAK